MVRLWLLLASGWMICASAIAQPCPSDPARDASVLLTVQWPGQAPQRMRAADLAALPLRETMQRRTLTPSAGASAATLEQSVRYGGVLLRDALNRAEAGEGNRRAARWLIFEAVATDGYRAFFSWGELFNASLGDQVLLILTQDGQPLPAEQGPLALRSLADLRPGPRHVRNLCAVIGRAM